MKIQELINILEQWAPPQLAESYDNCGLLVGDVDRDCTGILICLDCTSSVVREAIAKNCNLIVAHHPLIFSPLKRITGKNDVEKSAILAIENQINLYAIHTNLDNVLHGVNGKIAKKLGLENLRVLSPKKGVFKKLVTYIPTPDFERVTKAVFEAGAGNIGNYNHCGFSAEGTGTFKGNEHSNPQLGQRNVLEKVEETKFETIFPFYLERKILATLTQNHPYEEVACDVISLDNVSNQIGSGAIGTLKEAISQTELLDKLKAVFHIPAIRYTHIPQKIKTVAVCGGSGSFLRHEAKVAGADAFITGDFKYHEFFDAEEKIAYFDIGHYEGEQFATELILEQFEKNSVSLPTLISTEITNPIKYYPS